MNDADRVRIHYQRLPDREQIFDQRVVFRGDDVIVTLAESTQLDRALLVNDEPILEGGASVVWFTFPALWHDIGSFHLADGAFTGYYANILTPPRIDGSTWWTTDLFLDVWLPYQGEVQLLDEDEFESALQDGVLDAAIGRRAREEADRILSLADEGRWPPAIVQEWPLSRAFDSG